MNEIELLDGTVLSDVKLEISCPLYIEDNDLSNAEIHIQGVIKSQNGWYSNVIGLGDLSRVFCEEDVVRVKFILAKMNSLLKV